MRIVIDGRMWAEAGVGRYIRNLTYGLEKDSKNEYILLLLKKDFDSVKLKKIKKIEANYKWYSLEEQVKLPKLLESLKPDLVHFPHFNVPILYKGKFIVTIHDLIHQHFQMKRATTLNPALYKLKQIGYAKVFKNAIGRSVKIITVSEFVKNQLVKEWDVESDKIVVTYEAAEKFKNTELKNEFKVRPPFIFYVGNAHPHKNVEGLIKAFENLRKRYQYLTLVLSGGDHYFWEKIKQKYSNKNIIYTGFVTDEELAWFYKNATCYVVPSFEEGFGIPLLEAFEFGCPVVSSNLGSLPEIGQDAALYFNPRDQEDMVEKIAQVLETNSLRSELVKKGKKRVKEFSWEKCAKETMEVYRECELQ